MTSLLVKKCNLASDVSCTAGTPRLNLGLIYTGTAANIGNVLTETIQPYDGSGNLIGGGDPGVWI